MVRCVNPECMCIPPLTPLAARGGRSYLAAMNIAADPQWQQLALYALGIALVLTLLFRLPFIGRLFRALFSLALLAAAVFIILQQAPYDPSLSRLTQSLGLDSQEVTGDEVRIRMASDGHFWADAVIDGVERRILIDSGATVTALSSDTAAAGVERGGNVLPTMIRTANGTVRADTGTIGRLDLSGIEARDLKVVVSPSLGVDILGMNFLSQLKSWRVEGRTLIMEPPPEGEEAAAG